MTARSSFDNVGLELQAEFSRRLSIIRARYHDFGIRLEKTSSGALAQFSSLPTEQQQDVLAQLELMNLIAHDAELPTPDSSSKSKSFGAAEEIRSLKAFLKRASLRAANDDIFATLREGDLLEVYNTDHRQIYRSWSFFRFCSYSLGELLVFDWHSLYARPAWVVSRLFVDICDILDGRRQLIKMEVPEFLLAENFSTDRRAVLLKMRFCAALLDEETGEIRGYVCTAKATPALEPRTSDKIAFI